PRAVRASMGAVFEVALARVEQVAQLPSPTVALVAGEGEPLHELALDRQLTLMVGAEREGLAPELVAAADHVARIPIVTHSLNAAMAATVALYEVARRMPRT
ncbi:MAG: TrmH family RNA methyltransferase, partial [Solirubrobacteraceae bacterium]